MVTESGKIFLKSGLYLKDLTYKWQFNHDGQVASASHVMAQSTTNSSASFWHTNFAPFSNHTSNDAFNLSHIILDQVLVPAANPRAKYY